MEGATAWGEIDVRSSPGTRSRAFGWHPHAYECLSGYNQSTEKRKDAQDAKDGADEGADAPGERVFARSSVALIVAVRGHKRAVFYVRCRSRRRYSPMSFRAREQAEWRRRERGWREKAGEKRRPFSRRLQQPSLDPPKRLALSLSPRAPYSPHHHASSVSNLQPNARYDHTTRVRKP